MGRRASGTPSPFSRQIVKAVTRLRDEAHMTNVELIRQADFSPNYFYMRLRGDALFDTNDIDKLATAFGVSPADVIVLATSLSDDDEESGTITITDSAELARRLRFLSGPDAPTESVVKGLIQAGAEVTAAAWDALLAGSGPRRVAVSLLSAAAEHFGVDLSYLTELQGTDSAAQVEAEVSFQRALRDSGATAVAARALGDVSPGALIAITQAIRSIEKGRQE
ncbi:hypothetical protein CmiCFBP2404_14660 [Clavibacter michiganensis subsp. insidiosus]|nr:helix-turn-helix transcriptional regulator [Clavibacter michiganensis]AWF99881.1 hypothetical protein BEH61_15350 [Clavibacter michiganensis subsp. insidiosus]OQJ57043.1 hypothetical protein B5P21_15850 [Clavibacter michiganensis subsp. insidiosus]RMC83549.1 hypothetical protein CmiCFBP2404_14660 [Clavibacter michiganensis subsp. insidiosus]